MILFYIKKVQCIKKKKNKLVQCPYLFMSIYRQHCVKCRAVDTNDNPYTHSRPESRDTTAPVYDVIAVPEATPNYENIRDPPSV